MRLETETYLSLIALCDRCRSERLCDQDIAWINEMLTKFASGGDLSAKQAEELRVLREWISKEKRLSAWADTIPCARGVG